MKTLITLTTIALFAGCGHTPPTELTDARKAYQSAANSPAAQRAKSDLYQAKKALDHAEARFDDDGNTRSVEDLAYVAGRKARIAETIGHRKVATVRLTEARAQYVALSDEIREDATEQLNETEEALEEKKAEARAERSARLAAEAQLAAALEQLREFAKVAEEKRGLVITLSAGVLFAYDKSELLPPAYAKLDKVATMLRENPERQIRVEGHTDSHGGAAYNQTLSRERAEAVRLYLVSKGVAAPRIEAIGFGEARPVTSNDSPENRANNRRVEIVLDPVQ